jgi:hypothetical protein
MTTPRPIDMLGEYEVDQEIGHLEHLQHQLTQEGRERLAALRKKRDDDKSLSSYRHNDDEDDGNVAAAMIGFGLGSMLSGSFGGTDDAPASVPDAPSEFGGGGGESGGAGADGGW